MLTTKTFWQMQASAGLTNTQAAEWLQVTTRSIQKWRIANPEAPHAVMLALQYRIKYGDVKQ